ncbi:MAG: hypothetical protein QOE71_1076 [Pseudonocardiales bacterium]|nr:hypothetical protein [Pseudonocardiales bacterium]
MRAAMIDWLPRSSTVESSSHRQAFQLRSNDMLLAIKPTSPEEWETISTDAKRSAFLGIHG